VEKRTLRDARASFAEFVVRDDAAT